MGGKWSERSREREWTAVKEKMEKN
uniref:Nef protein n=1 Tax=Human immunodeficiency virus type 1 TaxID=11676 RepID=H1ADS6_HV1|nr:nef protein [Human immunodeficiency virus 1]